MKKKSNEKTLSQQLREIIENGSVSRYRLSKDAAVDASQLCRFVQGKGRLTTDSLDRIGKVLKLKFVSELEPTKIESKGN